MFESWRIEGLYAGSECDNDSTLSQVAPTSIRCLRRRIVGVCEERRLPLRRKQTTNPKGAEIQRLVSLLRVTVVVDVYVSCPFSCRFLNMCPCVCVCVKPPGMLMPLRFPFSCQFVALIRDLKTCLLRSPRAKENPSQAAKKYPPTRLSLRMIVE